jgi:probable HAF family extracellular repeat protein
MVNLGALSGGGAFSYARGISADGNVVVGYSDSSSGTRAFRWTSEEGMVGLGNLPDGSFWSSAYGVSPEGTVVVGNSVSSSGTEAFRWTSENGMVGLGDLPGGTFSSEARSTSGNGTVVVGMGNSGLGDEAFVWNAAEGMQSVKKCLISKYQSASSLLGWTLSEATGVSADGKVIVGNGTTPTGQSEGWVANLSDPATTSIVPLNLNYTSHAWSKGEAGWTGEYPTTDEQTNDGSNQAATAKAHSQAERTEWVDMGDGNFYPMTYIVSVDVTANAESYTTLWGAYMESSLTMSCNDTSFGMDRFVEGDGNTTLTGTLGIGTSAMFPAGTNLKLIISGLDGGTLLTSEWSLRLWSDAFDVTLTDLTSPMELPVLAGHTLNFLLTHTATQNSYGPANGRSDLGIEFMVIPEPATGLLLSVAGQLLIRSRRKFLRNG